MNFKALFIIPPPPLAIMTYLQQDIKLSLPYYSVLYRFWTPVSYQVTPAQHAGTSVTVWVIILNIIHWYSISLGT